MCVLVAVQVAVNSSTYVTMTAHFLRRHKRGIIAKNSSDI